MKYSFRCLNCKKESYLEFTFDEYMQRVEFICPKCGDKNMQRVFTVVPIHFRGMGFTKSIKEEE